MKGAQRCKKRKERLKCKDKECNAYNIYNEYSDRRIHVKGLGPATDIYVLKWDEVSGFGNAMKNYQIVTFFLCNFLLFCCRLRTVHSKSFRQNHNCRSWRIILGFSGKENSTTIRFTEV